MIIGCDIFNVCVIIQTKTFNKVLLAQNFDGVDENLNISEIMILEDWVSIVFKDFATNTFVVWQMNLETRFFTFLLMHEEEYCWIYVC